MTAFLPTDFSERPALADEETISDEELEARLRREQFEADAFARSRGKTFIGGIRVKYSDDQERDENGRFTSGGSSWGGLDDSSDVDAILGTPVAETPETSSDNGPIGAEAYHAEVLSHLAADLNADKAIPADLPLAVAIEARTGGSSNYTEDDHKLIVTAIQNAPENAPVLYRGFAMNESNGWTAEARESFTSQLQVGASIEMRLGSYTEDPKIVQEFAGVDSYLRPTGGVGETMPPIEGSPNSGIAADIAREEGFFITPTGSVIQSSDERMILAVQPGAQALNMQPNATPDFAYQAEWSTVGTFRVESVERTGPVWKVQLAQVDTVEPAYSDDGGDRVNGLPGEGEGDV